MYSPISPKENRINPEKKKMAAIRDAQPIIMAGFMIFRTITTMVPISPSMEKTIPRQVAMRSGTTEYPTILDQKA